MKRPHKKTTPRLKKPNPFDARTASLQILGGATAVVLVLLLLDPPRMINWMVNVGVILVPILLMIGVGYGVRQYLREDDKG